MLCPLDSADGGPVRVRFSERPGSGAYVHLDTGGWYRRGCDGTTYEPPPVAHSEPTAVEIDDLPTLLPPPGGRQDTHGSGSGGDYLHQSATLTWDGFANDAIAHYGTQLEATGWSPLSSGARPTSAAGTWTRDTDDGPQTVGLTALAAGPSTLRLGLLLAAYGR